MATHPTYYSIKRCALGTMWTATNKKMAMRTHCNTKMSNTCKYSSKIQTKRNKGGRQLKFNAEVLTGITVDSPGEHDHEVHDVPAVPQVGALMQRETQSQDLDARLETEDGYEVGLRVLLQKRRGGQGWKSSRKQDQKEGSATGRQKTKPKHPPAVSRQ